MDKTKQSKLSLKKFDEKSDSNKLKNEVEKLSNSANLTTADFRGMSDAIKYVAELYWKEPKEIELNISKEFRGLAGYDFGVEIYKNQVKTVLDKDDYILGFKIVFPKHITMFQTHFIDGFCDELIKEMGYKKFITRVRIEGATEEITNKIYKILY